MQRRSHFLWQHVNSDAADQSPRSRIITDTLSCLEYPRGNEIGEAVMYTVCSHVNAARHVSNFLQAGFRTESTLMQRRWVAWCSLDQLRYTLVPGSVVATLMAPRYARVIIGASPEGRDLWELHRDVCQRIWGTE